MRLRSLAVAVPLVLVLSACGGGEAETEAAPSPDEVTTEETQEAEPVTQEQGLENAGALEPCFAVPDVGTPLSMSWDLVVASRDRPDQKDYIEDVMDDGDDLYDEVEHEGQCAGKVEIAEFNYEVALLNVDVTLGNDTDEQYEKIADIGNDLLELSDDQGYEWDYKFISDVSELDY